MMPKGKALENIAVEYAGRNPMRSHGPEKVSIKQRGSGNVVGVR